MKPKIQQSYQDILDFYGVIKFHPGSVTHFSAGLSSTKEVAAPASQET